MENKENTPKVLGLEDYKKTITNPRYNTTATIDGLLSFKLPDERKFMKLKVIEGLNIGTTGKNKCDINRLIDDISKIEKDPDAYVIIGGNIFYSFTKQEKDNIPMFEIDEQIRIAEEIFEPIKDKIIGICSGKNEEVIERKEEVNPMLILASRLGIKDKYSSDGLYISVSMNNAWTGHKTKNIDISVSSIYTRAKLYTTVYKRAAEAGKKIGGADVNITTGTHKIMKSDTKFHQYSNKDYLVRKPHYEYTSAGYTQWGKKGEGPWPIDDNYLVLYVAKNKDADLKQGTNDIREESYKVYFDLENINHHVLDKNAYSITADYYQTIKDIDDIIDAIKHSFKVIHKDIDEELKNKYFEELKKVSEEKGE